VDRPGYELTCIIREIAQGSTRMGEEQRDSMVTAHQKWASKPVQRVTRTRMG
jgi:hypothetical protein